MLPLGEWSSIPPACERLQCPPIKIAFKDPNILADVSNFKPGDYILFQKNNLNLCKYNRMSVCVFVCSKEFCQSDMILLYNAAFHKSREDL